MVLHEISTEFNPSNQVCSFASSVTRNVSAVERLCSACECRSALQCSAGNLDALVVAVRDSEKSSMQRTCTVIATAGPKK